MGDAGVGESDGIGGRLMRSAGRGFPLCCVLRARLLYGTDGWKLMDEVAAGTTFCKRTSIFTLRQPRYSSRCAADQRFLHPTVRAAKA